MRETDDLDPLLNSALSTYADPGSNSGLEERILAGVFSTGAFVEATPASPLRWLPWAIALAAAACLLLLAILSGSRRTNHTDAHAFHPLGNQQPHTAANPLQRSAFDRIATPRSARTSALKSHLQPVESVAHAARLPKLDVFPTPRPLTHEEQALAVFAIHIPARELQALSEAQERDDAALSLAANDNQPLEPPDQGGN